MFPHFWDLQIFIIPSILQYLPHNIFHNPIGTVRNGDTPRPFKYRVPFAYEIGSQMPEAPKAREGPENEILILPHDQSVDTSVDTNF